jgi:hypothetical protein
MRCGACSGQPLLEQRVKPSGRVYTRKGKQPEGSDPGIEGAS